MRPDRSWKTALLVAGATLAALPARADKTEIRVPAIAGEPAPHSIVGKWTSKRSSWEFRADGTFREERRGLYEAAGTYRYGAGLLVITSPVRGSRSRAAAGAPPALDECKRRIYLTADTLILEPLFPVGASNGALGRWRLDYECSSKSHESKVGELELTSDGRGVFRAARGKEEHGEFKLEGDLILARKDPTHRWSSKIRFVDGRVLARKGDVLRRVVVAPSAAPEAAR